MQRWEITYLNYSGSIETMRIIGTILDAASVIPPNAMSGTFGILKIEKLVN